jgi:hypothetical protein
VDPIQRQEFVPGRSEPHRVPAGAVMAGTLGAALVMLGVVLAALFAVPVVQKKFAVLGVALVIVGGGIFVAAWAYGRRGRS